MPVINEPADIDHCLYWIALKQVPGIGNRIFKQLMDRFGDPVAVAGASRRALLGVDGMTPKIADALCRRLGSGGFTDGVKREYDLIRRRGYRLITQSDAAYPPLLLEIYDPPPYLYAHGRTFDFSPAVAIVGSRNPTAYGFSMAKRLGADLAAMGLVVVSGMAAGIDAAAHQGALSCGGRTVAVLGSGLMVIYPPENRRLYRDIVESGAVVSELPVMEPPNAYNFPARNRIISGMTLGTVVVEAAKKSGSLITARLAAEQGRDVFAVPGSIRSAKSTGAHSLLKQGAKLVETAGDVVEEIAYMAAMQKVNGAASAGALPPLSDNNASKDLTQAESDVYCLLEPYPVHIDDLAVIAGMDAGGLLAILLKLEIMGKAVQTPGKFFMSSGEV